MQLVVHPYFKDQILGFEKAAVMVQDKFTPGEEITFLCAENLKEVPFATATAKECAQLKIVPTQGQIFRKVMLMGVEQWLKLSKENARRVILVEGFKHVDDFYHNLQAKGTFEVNQIYFENLKPII